MTGTRASEPEAATSPAEGAPLDGILVADLSRVLAGPYCTMLLADLGATVIKVESAAGDDTRAWTPPEKDGISTYFMSINRNKRSIVLDFRDPDDVVLVHGLFRRADIAIENFKTGALVKHPLLLERAAQWNADDLFVALNEVGVPCGPINSIREGIELAERLGLEPRVTLGEDDRAVDVVRNPVRFSNASLRYDQPPPALGEHGDEIRAWLSAPVSES